MPILLALAVEPDTYSVPFVALLLGGIIVGSATVAALVAGPICYRRGKRETLTTIRRGTVRVSDYL